VYAVFRKELADHLASKRFVILFALVFLAAILAIYVAIQNIRSVVTPTTEFVFLKMFTTSGETLPSFPFFIALFIPVIGIALGFDTINSERASGNLSRLLSQPIYRDSVINGKFLAGLAVISTMIVTVIAIVAGVGLRIIGVPPSSEEILRLIAFAIITIIYGAFWMALAALFSVFFNRAATSMLASIALWIFFYFFMSIIAGAIANAQAPLGSSPTAQEIVRNATIQGTLGRISPCTLYGEATTALLTPELGSLNAALMVLSTFISGRMVTPLPFTQSLLLIWPQVVSIVALAAICFGVSYVKFMTEEIRSI
jgi:ABC-2 type transport system permease protein